MIIGQIGMQPYLNVPLQNNSVNDISVNAQNPSNTGVTTTSGIFGESNGAMEWNADTDKLSWSSAIGNTIAGKINLGCSVCFFGNFTDDGGIFNQRGNNPQGSFNIPIITSIDSLIVNYFVDGSTGSIMLDYAGFNAEYSNWGFMAINVIENGSNLDGELFWNGVSLDTGTSSKVLQTSTAQLRIGELVSGYESAKMKMMGFRFYDKTLNTLQLQIINAQKGRIAA
jgi:hypothetical protein